MTTATADERPITNDPDAERWPAVDLAHSYVLPSYQFLLNRFEAADTRLTALLTLASSLTVGVPSLARAVRPDIGFRSVWFLAGLALFLLGVIAGIGGRVRGRFVLPDPMLLYRKSLHESPWLFQKNQLFLAGQHFDRNLNAIRQKGNLALVVTGALVGEILAFLAWFALWA